MYESTLNEMRKRVKKLQGKLVCVTTSDKVTVNISVTLNLAKNYKDIRDRRECYIQTLKGLLDSKNEFNFIVTEVIFFGGDLPVDLERVYRHEH